MGVAEGSTEIQKGTYLFLALNYFLGSQSFGVLNVANYVQVRQYRLSITLQALMQLALTRVVMWGKSS